MKTKILFTILTLCFVTLVSCQNNLEKKVNQTKDTIVLKETFKQDDLLINEYLGRKLKPIRENFKKLNLIENWTEIKVTELSESTEGGEAKFYYQNQTLEKIITHRFGETFQKITEYYILNGELSFVFEKSYKYNRPIYWDKKKAEEILGDDEVFDFNKSAITEDRSYFINGKLLHQLKNQHAGSPLEKKYLLEEQKRLILEFESLLKLEKKK